MEKKIKENFDAMTAVDTLSNQHPEIWENVLAYATALAAMGVKRQAILNTAGQQQKNSLPNCSGGSMRLLAATRSYSLNSAATTPTSPW